MQALPLITITDTRCNNEPTCSVLQAQNNEHHCAMNTTIPRSLLLLATVFTLGYTRAAEPVRMKAAFTKKSALDRALDRALNATLSYPLLEKVDMSGQVHVSFVINKEGRIEVIESSSSNEKLQAFVLRKLARIDIGENPNGSWKTTHMVFNFHPEKS
jgi:hypothetical protein